MPRVAIVSFRLGGNDGVSIEAGKWSWALGVLGFEVRTVAGSGPVERVVPGLAIAATDPPGRDEVEEAVEGCDLVVVENLCSLPLNPPAAAAVAAALAGRPAILHHHDLPWQRPQFVGRPAPPDDPAWRHVTINRLSRFQLARRGIEAVTLYNTFDPDPPAGRREATRQALGVGDGDRLVLQPTRAIPRKNVAGAIALAEAVGATYWLLGPAEDGYGPELDRLLAAARCPVLRGGVGAAGERMEMADAYAAADVVALPSTWEGFGNPTVESATHRRPLAVGQYPVAVELAEFGFEWFPADDPSPLSSWLDQPDPGLLDRNADVAREHFCIRDLPDRLAPLVRSVLE